jgi:hypothetical protein
MCELVSSLPSLSGNFSFAPSGLGDLSLITHGLRRGLHSFAASRLRPADNCSIVIGKPWF